MKARVIIYLILLRNMHGLSQEKIAGEIGISRQAYAKWENGASVPDIEKCERLAAVYGVTIDSLVKTTKLDGAGVIPPPAGKAIWGAVVINERGQLVIPKAVREIFGLAGGAKLIVLTDEAEGIALIPEEMLQEKMKQAMAYASVSREE